MINKLISQRDNLLKGCNSFTDILAKSEGRINYYYTCGEKKHYCPICQASLNTLNQSIKTIIEILEREKGDWERQDNMEEHIIKDCLICRKIQSLYKEIRSLKELK